VVKKVVEHKDESELRQDDSTKSGGCGIGEALGKLLDEAAVNIDIVLDAPTPPPPTFSISAFLASKSAFS
jgi:hypothetical protein